MIYEKIYRAEQKMKSTVRVNMNKLTILEDIKEYVSRIDNKSEFLAVNNMKKLKVTISSLKGKALDEEEDQLINEVFESEVG